MPAYFNMLLVEIIGPVSVPTYNEECDGDGHREVKVGDGEAHQGADCGVLVQQHLQQRGQTGETKEGN